MSTVGTVEGLVASATELTNLTDFGGDDFVAGMTVLLDSFEREAELTELGAKVKRAELRGGLVARLMCEASWARHPQAADVAIERPIFVTGLPRTGTTALHRLLCADPQAQGLEQWLCDVPQPRPPRETWADNPVHRHIAAWFAKFHAERPQFAGVHYIDADTVEECWQLLRQSALSVSYESLAHIPTYSRWLAGQDWTPAYLRHRRNLALIGLNDAGKRWVLKNPSHLFALDALLAVYPDAMIVQTHRDPREAVASSCSLSALATQGYSTAFTGATIGADQLALLSRGAATFASARRKYDAARFLDVRYTDLVADPVGTVRSVYAHFGLDWTTTVEAAVTAEHSASRSGPRAPSHRYALADFGLTAEQVEAAFAAVSTP